jgi:hypothetical protein
MFFLLNQFSERLIDFECEKYSIESMEEEDTSAIVLDILEILDDIEIAKELIGKELSSQFKLLRKMKRKENKIYKKKINKKYENKIHPSGNTIEKKSIQNQNEEYKIIFTSEKVDKNNGNGIIDGKISIKGEQIESFSNFLKLFVEHIKEKEKSIRLVQIITSRLISRLLERMIEECQLILGKAPCEWCLISIGSLSRMEICPYSDLECIMLIEEQREENKKYFNDLCRLLEYRVIALGETEYELFPFGSLIEGGFLFDKSLKPIPNYIITPKQLALFQKEKKKTKDWTSMNEITAIRTPSFLVGNENLLLDYEKFREEIM